MFSDLNLKTVTTLIAVIGLLFSIFQFIQVQKTEAAKPYLEKKLSWCEEVVELTSDIAATYKLAEPAKPSQDKIKRFWQMYWGVLGLVEKTELAGAMVAYSKALDNNPAKNDLGTKSLAIAHACRKELTSEWSAKWGR